MEPNQRGSKAFSAMKKLGVPKDTVKRVLKKLLKLYGNNWELIEEDNYRTLADAIFEEAEDKAREDTKNDAKLYDGTEPPSKRPHLGQQEDRASLAADSRSKMLLLKEERKRYAAGDSGGQVMVPDIGPLGSDTFAREMIVKKSISESSKQPTGQEEMNFFKRIRDITKGKERVTISLLDEIGNERLPDFVYMSQSVVHQNAYVHVSLARIADEDSCPSCIGDCISNIIPCACARDTGGEFAYTTKGLLKEEFLRACISVTREPQKHYKFVCQECPLEKAKNMYRPEPCKGHLIRKFIKECWTKCGCDMQCGNRVVQRGISCHLQVFLTNEGKGWGLRTLQELPEGAFVCEYAGEILTNMELYERNKKSSGDDRHTYPVLLDADWGSEGVLNDEDALCLDATFYGNVARFINHRCSDANLLEVPVEVENPDHHYYHLAFFTNRKVEAFEELTWDYGIDFTDRSHPIKAFRCCCA
ncbi:hypothetical protein RJ639_037008, partial [Escallonia herrerae]